MTRSRGTCADSPRGEWLAAFALTEAGRRERCSGDADRAPSRDGDTYVLDGAKAFITGAGDADLYIVMARTGDGAHGISAFLVEAAWPGVSAGAPLAKMGLHGSWTGELVLDGVRVPAANRLGDEGVGFHGRDVGARQRKSRHLRAGCRHRSGSARCRGRDVAAALGHAGRGCRRDGARGHGGPAPPRLAS